jgi:O-antigen ligase
LIKTLIKKSGWTVVPIAFFLYLNFSVSSAKVLFFNRLSYFLLLVSLFLLLRRFHIDKILRTLIGWIGSILFIYGILQKFVLFPLYLKQIAMENNFYSQAVILRIKSGRIFSLFALPTLYAIVCAVLVIFIFHYMITTDNKRKRIMWGVLLFAGLANLVLTQSFAGILYLSIGGIAYLLLSGILKPKFLIPVLTILMLFLSITIALRFSEFKKFEPFKLRLSNWTQAVRMIESAPIWGIGLGNYENKVAHYTLGSEAKSIYAHNFFLQFAAESGIIILILIHILLFMIRDKIIPDDYKQKAVYITAASVLLIYNLIDIGFYFFSAGIISVVILSRIYPDPLVDQRVQLSKEKGLMTIMGVCLLLSLILGLQTISNNQRKAGDFLKSQNNISESIAEYRSSITWNPFNYRGLRGFSDNTFPEGSKETLLAEQFLNRALALNPDSAYSHYLKSQSAMKQKHFIIAYYHAAAAYQKNKLVNQYKQWFHSLKKNLEDMFKPQGNSK